MRTILILCTLLTAFPAAGSEYVFLGAAQSHTGANGSDWSSDFSVSFAAELETIMGLGYYAVGGWEVSKDATIIPGTYAYLYENVLATLFGGDTIGTFGTMVVDSDIPISAFMQTWTHAPGGRYGQTIRPSVPLANWQIIDITIPADRVNMLVFNGSYDQDGIIEVNGETWSVGPRETIFVDHMPMVMRLCSGCSPWSGTGDSDLLYVLFSGVDNGTNDATTYQVGECLCCLPD